MGLQHMVEQRRVVWLKRQSSDLPRVVVSDPYLQCHLHFMFGAANEDVVSHDHLIAFVEEGDPLQL